MTWWLNRYASMDARLKAMQLGHPLEEEFFFRPSHIPLSRAAKARYTSSMCSIALSDSHI